ncbi:EamA family transporter [Rhodobacteraceae bacterium WD3A24]|nr:EamA family transporter [Rhodobacteraceae bacterium WD3A24]
MSRIPPRLRGHLAMLVFSALVAGSFSLGALAANEIAPAALNAVRFLIAALILGPIAWAGPGLKQAYFAAPWRYLVLGGIFAIYFVLMFEGLKTATPVSTSAIFTLTPLMAAGFGFVLLRQLMTGRIMLALATGGAGAIWVIFRGDIAALAALDLGRGEAIFFIGCVAHAAFTPLLRRLNRGEPGVVATFGVMVGSCLVLLVWGWGPLWTTEWTALPTVVWVTILYVAVMASAVTTFLLQYAAQLLPSSKVMAYTYLTPTWVIGWELGLGHGIPPATVLPGIALTTAALVLLLKPGAEERGAAPPAG